jgi:ATP-dependent helicase/nuclease subunit A
MINWTEQQKKAFAIHNHNVLVSAGAGSGKTAVLTQRIINILSDKTNGAKLSELLVLTFTNKAAFVMRSRVKKAMKNIPELASNSEMVDSSNITTFDAYALSIVKKYGYLIGLSRNISITDESIFMVKAKTMLDEIFMRYYKEKSPEFSDMVYKYCVSNDDNLKDAVFSIINIANLQLNKEEFYKTYEDKYFSIVFLKIQYKDFYNTLKNQIKSLRKIYLEISDTSIVDALDNIYYNPLYDDNYETLYRVLSDKALSSFKISSKADDSDKEIYNEVKKSLTDIKKLVKEVGNYDTILANELESQKHIRILLNIAKELDDSLFNYKKEFGVFSFSDISSLAYQLICLPVVKEELKKEIKFIMIDEYQDTSDIQDAFIHELSQNNAFMVGDIKQSIYRFRNANPKLFQRNFVNYQKGDGGELINLPDNYRSRREVINTINDIFKDVMSEDIGGVSYDENQKLNYGNNAYDILGHTTQQYGVEFKQYNEGDFKDISPKEIEARLIAEDILLKVNSSYQIYDRDKKELRPCSFNDFAILIDRKSNYDSYEKVFNEYKIPLLIEDEKDVRNTHIILAIKSILKMISFIYNNSLTGCDFEHAFASIARSYLFSYSDDKIFSTIKNNKISQSEIFLTAKECANKIKELSLIDSMILIINSFKIHEKLYILGDILPNQSILDNIYSLCRNMDGLHYSFSDMVCFFQDLDNYDLSLKLDCHVSTDDSVKIMTMHKSKGLEFHIIYCSGLGVDFNNVTYSGNNVFSSEYGFHLVNKKAKDASYIFKYLFQNKEKAEDISEKIRLLYVCLTRAEENAIVLIPHDNFVGQSSNLTNIKSFTSIIKGFHRYNDYVSMVNLSKQSGIDVNIDEDAEYTTIQFKQIHVDSKMAQDKRASKNLQINYDKDALLYGVHMHELLQIVNFKTKDISFIKEEKDRYFIKKLLENHLFDHINEAKTYQELDFFDKNNNIHGTIDMLAVYDDHVDIIDYKLKGINDDEYIIQLQTYENYVKTILDLPIKKYLVSVIDDVIKEVY